MTARLATTLLVLSLVAASSSFAEAVPAAADAALPDQHGRTDSVAAHRDHVTVVMVVTAARLRNLRAWQKELQERFDSVHFLLIADVPAEPAVTYERVAEKLAQRVPEEVSVLIDIERRWAEELDLDTDRPNLLLFDRQGLLVSTFRGRERPELVEQVSQALEALVGP